jgi:hypothetical protein
MSIVNKVYFVLPEVVSANTIHETFLESRPVPITLELSLARFGGMPVADPRDGGVGRCTFAGSMLPWERLD